MSQALVSGSMVQSEVLRLLRKMDNPRPSKRQWDDGWHRGEKKKKTLRSHRRGR